MPSFSSILSIQVKQVFHNSSHIRRRRRLVCSRRTSQPDHTLSTTLFNGFQICLNWMKPSFSLFSFARAIALVTLLLLLLLLIDFSILLVTNVKNPLHSNHLIPGWLIKLNWWWYQCGRTQKKKLHTTRMPNAWNAKWL